MIRLTPRLEASNAVVIPVQPYASSSATRLLSKTPLSKPPAIDYHFYLYIRTYFFLVYLMHTSKFYVLHKSTNVPRCCGIDLFMRPMLHAFLIMSHGYAPVLSNSAAAGIISSLVNFRASSCISF